jgi:hypothetical protein
VSFQFLLHDFSFCFKQDNKNREPAQYTALQTPVSCSLAGAILAGE